MVGTWKAIRPQININHSITIIIKTIIRTILIKPIKKQISINEKKVPVSITVNLINVNMGDVLVRKRKKVTDVFAKKDGVEDSVIKVS